LKADGLEAGLALSEEQGEVFAALAEPFGIAIEDGVFDEEARSGVATAEGAELFELVKQRQAAVFERDRGIDADEADQILGL